MATFKYIGTLVKANGKVDVRVPQGDGTSLYFEDVQPNVTVLDAGDDAFGIRALEYGVDILGALVYERIN